MLSSFDIWLIDGLKACALSGRDISIDRLAIDNVLAVDTVWLEQYKLYNIVSWYLVLIVLYYCMENSILLMTSNVILYSPFPLKFG